MSVMNVILGVTALALGLAMVWVGMPKGGVSPAFMRNSFLGMLYTVACLLAFVAGIGGILSALPWSF